MANKPPRKSAKNNKRRGSSSDDRRSRRPDDRRSGTVRDSAEDRGYSREDTRPRSERDYELDDEDMLSEFSDETNEFYVDERRETERRPHSGSSGKNRSKDSERRQRDEKRREDKRRRNAEKRERAEKRKPLSPLQRRLIRIISYGAIITVVLIVGVVLSLTVLFKTQAYEVTGSTKYSESELIDACGIGKGQNIFLAPKRPAEKRIKEKFAYIEEADVSFKIPDTIRISVIEAVEGYMVKVSDTEYLVISTKGRILDKAADKSAYDLPIFIGPRPISGEIGDYVSYEDETVLSMIDSITQTFTDNGYQGITEIDATNTADISFTYDNRVKVKLGIPEDLDYKIRTAMTIINENLDKNNTGTIQGVLDVSRCNTTRRSYFNEKQIGATTAPTEDPSQPSTEAGTPSGGGTDNSGGEWTADNGSGGETDLEYDFYDEDGYGHFWSEYY